MLYRFLRLFTPTTRIPVEDLLQAVPALQDSSVKIGFADGPADVCICNPYDFTMGLDAAVRALHELWDGLHILVDVDFNSAWYALRIRCVSVGARRDRSAQEQPAHKKPFRSLRSAVARNGGEFHYVHGSNYFDLTLPCQQAGREPFPNVKHLPWNDRYRKLLSQAAWSSLRDRVFRFSNLAASIAARCLEVQLSRVVIPSVGLCVHPWLFANAGLSVVATDSAASALRVLAQPADWPQLLSRAAFERWDISKTAAYAGANPERFDNMPALEDPAVTNLLRERIAFVRADWTHLPVAKGSVDALFAANALPREHGRERESVLKSWVEAVRPRGIVFVVQHNDFENDIETCFHRAGWANVNLVSGKRLPTPTTTAYQVWHSSG